MPFLEWAQRKTVPTPSATVIGGGGTEIAGRGAESLSLSQALSLSQRHASNCSTKTSKRCAVLSDTRATLVFMPARNTKAVQICLILAVLTALRELYCLEYCTELSNEENQRNWQADVPNIHADNHTDHNSKVEEWLTSNRATAQLKHANEVLSEALVYKWRLPDNTSFDDLPLFQYCNWKKTRKNQPAWNVSSLLTVPTNFTHSSHPQDEIHILLNSSALLRQSDAGTGNWVSMLYIFRLIMAQSIRGSTRSKWTHPKDLILNSLDCKESQSNTVLPWLSGIFDSAVTMKLLTEYWSPTTIPFFHCMIGGSEWGSAPMIWAFPLFQYDLRRMAIFLVGPPRNDPQHPAHAFQNEIMMQEQQYKRISYQLPLEKSAYPLFPKVTLDDVAIHFRCGDVMASKYDNFHFLKFSAYARRINGNKTKSIGIVTQPFKDQTRMNDKTNYDDFQQRVCEDVVRGMQRFLQNAFPDARVSIRNDPSETVALAFARLIMAKQAFASPDSTFSVFPVLSSFGTGYHLRPQKKNVWLVDNADAFATKAMANQVIMDEPVVMNARTTKLLRRKDEEKAPYHILQWFLNDTYVLPKLPKRNF